MKAKIRGTEIFFDIAGMQISPDNKKKFFEKPVLFLIHGGPGGNHLHFKLDSIKLQDYAQLIFIDQRGCGFSKKSKKSSYTLENNIEDIEALRQYLGLNKISVLGVSYGGMVAQGYAVNYSRNIEKLFLISTAPSFHFIEKAKDTLKKIGTDKQVAICEKYLWNGRFRNDKEVDEYFKLMDPLYIYKSKKRVKPSSKKISVGEMPNVLAYDVLNYGFSTFLHKFNFIPNLKKINCPTLIMVGKNDWICSPQHSQVLANSIPNSTLKIFKNCGHALTTDVNEQYVKNIIKFLKS